VWTRDRRRGVALAHCPNGHEPDATREAHTCETCGEVWQRVPARGQCPKSGPCCRGAKNRKRLVACWVCGASVAKWDKGSRHRHTCGDACHAATSIGLGHYPTRTDWEYATTRAELVVYVGECACCGEPFERELYEGTAPRYCTSRCRRRARASRAYHSRRESVGEVERIDAALVFIRDGWLCYLCDEPVDRHDFERVPGADGRLAFKVGPRYPSLDHVEPVARGGAHAYANLRTAHHLCNAVKSDH
jgi:hypothetical protein